MKIKRENLSKSRIKLNIEIPTDKTQKYFDEAYKKLSPGVEIKGFRSGQAPKSMIMESIGYGKYNQTALDFALQETYYQAIQEEKIIPIQPPAVSVNEFSEGKPFTYSVEVDIMPEINLGDYKKIKIKYKKPKIEVKDEEVNRMIEKLRYQTAAYNSVSRPAKKGDRIEIDFEGSVDNVKQENLTSKNHPIILGEGVLIPGFEKEIEGMKKDDKREFDLEVPYIKDRSKKQKAHFVVKMLDVKEVVLPSIDKEFSNKFGHDTPEKLKEAINAKLLEEKETVEKQKLEKEVIQKIASQVNVNIPESLIEQETNRRISQIQGQMGPGFEKYLESIKKSVDDLKKDLKKPAEESVKIGLILGEIAKKEGFVKGKIKDQKEHEEVIRKTVNMLIENAIK